MKRGAAAFLVAMLGASAMGTASSAKQLLSIQDLPFRKNEYVLAFDIRAIGVRALGVCRIPDGWSISAGGDSSPYGELSGLAGHASSALDARHLDALKQLFVVEMLEGDLAAPRRHGVAFEGRVLIGTYGVDAQPQWRPLPLSSYVLSAADRCP